MPKLNLEEFIYQVKKELLESQEKHEDELGYFKLRNVELEVSLTASYSGRGKLDLQVVQIGSELAREHVHKVRLMFDLVDQSDEEEDVGDLLRIAVKPHGNVYLPGAREARNASTEPGAVR